MRTGDDCVSRRSPCAHWLPIRKARFAIVSIFEGRQYLRRYGSLQKAEGSWIWQSERQPQGAAGGRYVRQHDSPPTAYLSILRIK